MLIKTLEMQAFGPFVNKTVIDFTNFYGKTFVITGNTGAGKTSIFDAVTLALFGTASGSERGAETMRCRHADESAVSYVELTFTHGGKEYLVHRELDEKGLKRADSYIRENSRRLDIRDVEADKGAKNNGAQTGVYAEKSLDKFISELIGCKPEVFRQIYMLAQNEFTKFLHCTTAERTEILRTILHTEEYKQFEEKLTARAAELKEEQKDLVREFSSLKERLAAAGIDATPAESKTQKDSYKKSSVLYSLAAEWYDGLIIKQKQADAAIAQARKITDEAKAALEEAQRQNELIEKRAALREAKAKLDAEKPEIAALAQTLRVESNSVPVKKAFSDLHTAERKHSECENQIRAVSGMIEQQRELHAAAEERKRQAEERYKDYSGLIRAAQTITEKLEQYDRAQRELNELRAALEALRASLPEMTARCEETKNRVLAEETALVEQRAAADTLSERIMERQRVKSRYDAAAGLLESVRELRSLNRVAEKALAEREEKLRAKNNAESAYNRLVAQYIHTTAARLAEKLKIGDTCPLCGGEIKHFPDFGSEAVITDEMIEQERRRASAAGEAFSRAAAAAEHSAEEYNSAKEETARRYREIYESDMPENAEEAVAADIEGIAAELDRSNSAAARAEQARDGIKQREERLGGLRIKAEEYSGKLAALEADIKNAEAACEKSIQNAAAAEGALPDGSRKAAENEAERLCAEAEAIDGAYKAAEKHEKEAAEQLAVLVTTVGEKKSLLASLENDIAQYHGEAQRLLAEYGFEDERAAFDVACLTQRQRAEYEQRISAHGNNCAIVAHDLAELSEKLPESAASVDTEELLQKSAECAQRTAELESEKVDCDSCAAVAAQLVKETQALAEKADEFSGRFDVISQLHKLVSGGVGSGKPRLSLECFVQRARFDRVLERANAHYSQMSEGRYMLQSRNAVISGRTAQGLDLEVVDNTVTRQGANKVRDVRSLSGGESFEAAFALAMGLSDYAMAVGGGARSEMLFVDEGFSSLDSESFGKALDVIDRFSAGDRMLGLVSHIAEIREHFTDNRVEVVSENNGSAVTLVCDGAVLDGGV